MRKKNPRRKGLAATPAELDSHHADGYHTPGELAAELGVSLSTIYSWTRDDKVALVGEPRDGLAFRERSILWLHRESFVAHGKRRVPA